MHLYDVKLPIISRFMDNVKELRWISLSLLKWDIFQEFNSRGFAYINLTK